MNRLSLMTFAAALLVSKVLAETAITPSAVLESIETSGARPTLERIYADEVTWAALLSGIATGSAAWVSVAKALKPVSDAGSSEQITLALGEALRYQPEALLSLSGSGFGLEDICGGPDVDDGRFRSNALAQAEIDRRIRSVKTVTRQDLLPAAAACVTSLNAARADIARFYGDGK